jgi:hypothetical protein
MKDRYVVGGGFLLVGALLTGCDMGASSTPSDPVKTACESNYNCMRQLMVHYRTLAADRMRMAEEYAREADYQALELGQDSPGVRTTRALAKKARSEAQEAAFLARQYEIQLPPKEQMSHM